MIFCEFEVCKTICEYLQEGTDFIDIGANIGLVTLGVKKMLKNNDKSEYVKSYHCFECNQDTFSHLRYNTKNHHNISLYNFGLSNTLQIGNMEINNYNNGCSIIKRTFNNNNNEFEEISYKHLKNIDSSILLLDKNIYIALLPLDSFIDSFTNKVSLIKIDVEGFEYNVLDGAREFIQTHKPAIIIEIIHENLEKDNNLLTIYNYECKGKIEKSEYISEDYLYTYKI